MSCDLCRHLEDISDLARIYIVRACGCGREMKLRPPGDHGIGLRTEAGDKIVIPADALKISANPLKGAGHLSRSGVAWFAELVFGVEFGKRENRDNVGGAIQALIDWSEQQLKQSEQLKHIDFEKENAGELIYELTSKNLKSIEWWTFSSATFYSMALEAVNRGDAADAVWAMAVAERFRTLALFREHFEDVVFMGHSARRLVELLNIWDANRENADEEFWQATLAAHAYAIGQLFAVPVTLIKEKAYVGGQTLERTDARLLDFMLSGALSDDAILLEIKTPTTRLLGSQYRTNAFPPSADVGGAVVQVGDYCQSFRENMSSLTKGLDRRLTAFNPKCVVLVGNYAGELTDAKKRASFELFRGSLRGIEVVTFDEFFRKVENLAKLFNLVRKSAAPAAADAGGS